MKQHALLQLQKHIQTNTRPIYAIRQNGVLFFFNFNFKTVICFIKRSFIEFYHWRQKKNMKNNSAERGISKGKEQVQYFLLSNYSREPPLRCGRNSSSWQTLDLKIKRFRRANRKTNQFDLWT